MDTGIAMPVGATGFHEVHTANGASARMVLQNMRVHRAYPEFFRRISRARILRAICRMGRWHDLANTVDRVLSRVIRNADHARKRGQQCAEIENTGKRVHHEFRTRRITNGSQYSYRSPKRTPGMEVLSCVSRSELAEQKAALQLA